jgi:hypothetical protein
MSSGRGCADLIKSLRSPPGLCLSLRESILCGFHVLARTCANSGQAPLAIERAARESRLRLVEIVVRLCEIGRLQDSDDLASFDIIIDPDTEFGDSTRERRRHFCRAGRVRLDHRWKVKRLCDILDCNRSDHELLAQRRSRRNINSAVFTARERWRFLRRTAGERRALLPIAGRCCEQRSANNDPG